MNSTDSNPSTIESVAQDIAGDVDRRAALRAVDPDAVRMLERPQAVIAVELDEPGDRDVDDMPGRVGTPATSTGGGIGTDS